MSRANIADTGTGQVGMSGKGTKGLRIAGHTTQTIETYLQKLANSTYHM